jgi:uncharacterized protein (TIGR03382 family)
MHKTIVAVATLAALAASAADAAIVGFAAFSRRAGLNNNVVIDLVAVTSNANDRLLNAFNVNLRNNAGPGGSTRFRQFEGPGTSGWRPDAVRNTRDNSTDSFCTIGTTVDPDGTRRAAAGTSADGGFTTGWSNFSPTIPLNAGWLLAPPTGPENVAESLANGLYGVWVGHWVMDGSTTSSLISLVAAVKDGNTGNVTTFTASNFEQLPAPGAIALLGVAGVAGSRRRRA